jgi:hypothetical protein
VADATCLETDEHLPGPWRREIDLLHDEGTPELLQHGSPDLHFFDPISDTFGPAVRCGLMCVLCGTP